MLGSGGAALRSKLKALDKAPSQQVDSMMQEPSKWVARSQMAAGAALKVGGGAAQAGQPGRDERDEETFEDTEFYQVALKVRAGSCLNRAFERLRSAGAGLTAGGSRHLGLPGEPAGERVRGRPAVQ